MLQKILKKHIENLIKNDKEYVLEYLKKEFVGVATYIDADDFEFTINNFCGYDDFDNHIANFNNVLKKLENKKEKAIKIYNLKDEELYLVSKYLTLEEIDLVLSGDSEIDKEFWELYADISELMGRKVVRDEQGNCIEVSYN